MLDTLDRLDLWKDTVVVLAGDNGYHLGDHGGLFRKDTLFEEALHVPLVVAAPGLARRAPSSGPRSSSSTSTRRWSSWPASPPSPASTAGASSLSRRARTAPGAARALSYRRVQPPERAWSLRTEAARYTVWPDGSEELYDLRSRGGETENLAVAARARRRAGAPAGPPRSPGGRPAGLPGALRGMSLPLPRAGAPRRPRPAGRTVGFLYGINMLGAALGAALAPWVLVRHLGVRGRSSRAPAAQTSPRRSSPSGSCAGVPPGGGEGHASPRPPPVERSSLSALWLALFALSGFCALSLEILWFRIVDVGVKSSAFTFGTVLAIYLLGSAAGALAARRARRPAWSAPCRVSSPCSARSSSTPALASCSSPASPRAFPVEWFFRLLAGLGGFRLGTESDTGALLGSTASSRCSSTGRPPSSWACRSRCCSTPCTDAALDLPPEVGFLQAANIAGCVAGSLLRRPRRCSSWLGTAGHRCGSVLASAWASPSSACGTTAGRASSLGLAIGLAPLGRRPAGR